MIFPTKKKKRAKPSSSPASTAAAADDGDAGSSRSGSSFALLPHAVHFSKRLRVMVDPLLYFDHHHQQQQHANQNKEQTTITTDGSCCDHLPPPDSWCSSTTSTNTTASTQSLATMHTTTPTEIDNGHASCGWRGQQPPQTPPPPPAGTAKQEQEESRQEGEDDNDDDNSRTSFRTSIRERENRHHSTPVPSASNALIDEGEDDSTWYSSSACGGEISAAAQRRGAFTDGMVLRQRRRLHQPLHYSTIDDDRHDCDDYFFEYDHIDATGYFAYSDHPIRAISSPLEACDNLQLRETEEEPKNTGRRSKRNKYLIPAESPFKLLWDVLTGVLSFLHAYATHMAIRDRQFMNPLIRFCEVCFVVDVLLNFVSERKVEGRVLSTYRSVWARYLTSWFVVDVLSLVPFELLYVQPIIEQQNRRRWFQKFFFRSRAVVRVTRALRIPHFRAFGQVSRGTGLGANRLIRLLIRYVPKYLMFWRNMKAAVAVRLLRHVHSLRRVWCNLIGSSSNVTAAAAEQLRGVGDGDDITTRGHIIPDEDDDEESVDILDVGVVIVPSATDSSNPPGLAGEDAVTACWEYVNDDEDEDDDCCFPY